MARITINIPDAQAKRVLDAFTEALELEKPATADDVKQYIIDDLKQFVRTSERRVAEKAARPGTDVELT